MKIGFTYASGKMIHTEFDVEIAECIIAILHEKAKSILEEAAETGYEELDEARRLLTSAKEIRKSIDEIKENKEENE